MAYVAVEFLNENLSRFDRFGNKERSFAVFVSDVGVDVELMVQGAEEVVVVVGCGGVEEGVAVGVLGGGDGRVGTKEWQELGGVVRSEDEDVGGGHTGVTVEQID